MSSQDPVDTSFMFSLSGIREQMKEKKNGALKTTKINASVAAKIRTKAINNSSIIKVTLKQNNKALALALSAARKEAQALTKEKMLLQKEVKLGDFERAHLRQKLSAVVNLFVGMYHKHHECIEEIQQFMNSQLHAITKLSSCTEKDFCSLLLVDGRLCTTDMTDKQADSNSPVRTPPKAMRIPLVQEDIDKCENGPRDFASTSQPTFPLPTLAPRQPLKNVANPAVKKLSSSCLMEELLANSKRNGQPSGEMADTTLALDFGAIFEGNPLSIPQSSRSSLSMQNNNSNLGQCSRIIKSYSDQIGLPLGHVTERRNHTVGFSASSRDSPCVELSDNGPLVGLMLPKEMEPPEISQLDEFVTLKAQNKSYKINARKAEALKKMSMGTKGRVSPTSKSEGNLDNCNKGAAPNTSQPKAFGFNTMSTELYAQVDHLEKIQPWNSHGQYKSGNSQRFSKTEGPSTILVASPHHVHDLSFSKNNGSSVKLPSQHSDKTGGHEKISVVDLTPRKRKTSIQEPKNKTHVMKSKALNQCQSLESFSLLGSPPSALPVLLDDAFSDGDCRKWFKTIPKVQEFSAIQNTTSLKTSSSSLEKTCLGVGSQVADLKREDKKPKANRKAHTENNTMYLSLDSQQVAEAAKGQKTLARSCVIPKISAVVSKTDIKQESLGGQETMQKTPKESSTKTAPQLNENMILKDLTNATQNLCHSTLLENPLMRRGTRAKKPVTYEEPKLNRKLRRGDPLTNSDFFSCPINKTRKIT